MNRSRSRSSSRRSGDRRRSPRELGGRIVRIALISGLGLALIGTVWIGVRGALAASHLLQAQQLASGLQNDLVSNPASANEAVASVAEDAQEARALTSDPVWRAGEALPWIGPQLSAVSTVAAAFDDVVDGAATPIAEIAPSLFSALTPSEGRFDIDALADAREEAQSAAVMARSSAQAVESVDSVALLGPLSDVVGEASAALDTVASASEALANVTTLLPTMLGADGPRDYLLLFQNNAEWRSLGGIAGSLLALHTDQGALTMGEQASSTTLTQYESPVLTLTEDLDTIYDQKPARFAHNVTQLPDFSLGAQLAREFWSRDHGTVVDGIIAVDAVTLSYLLQATGPVRLSTGEELSAGNAVDLLLNDVYVRYPEPSDQDAFFEEATSAVFDEVISGGADPSNLLTALSRAGEENRLFIWNERDDEQEVLDGTTLQGRLHASDDDATRFGVYLNDGTGSKLDYYLSAGATAQWCSRVQTGYSNAALHVEIRSDLPADISSLPRYITGVSDNGLTLGGTTAGVARTVTYVYLPEEATLSSVEVSNGEAREMGFHDGRRVVLWETMTGPGETATLDLVALTTTGAALDVAMTPVINGLEPSSLGTGCPGMR